VRPFAVLFVVALLSSMALIYVPSVGAAHGCAPSTPPTVPGSPASAPATRGVVLINEVLLNPQSRWNCSEPGSAFSAQDAWVELYNPQNQAFNLYAAHAYLDSGPATNPYYFPFGASIAAHGFLVIFPRIDATFVLTETSTLRLLIAGVIIDQITVPNLSGDQAYARITDGASKWQVTNTPTIDASNNSSQPTSIPTLASTSTGNQGRGGQGNGSTTTMNTPVVDGTQPAWAGLQLPTPTAVPTSAPTAGVSSLALPASPSSTSDGLDIARRIGLTLLVIALVLTLLWCWRLLRQQGNQR
jgi:hypothetical protein